MKLTSDSVAFIFGGTSGIGLETGRILARRGASVAIFGRRPDVLEEACASLRAEPGADESRIFGHCVDVTDFEAVKSAADAASGVLGDPHLLVNTAGRAIPGYFEEISCEQFRQTLDVNLQGPWHTIKALEPALKRTKGWIVNTASIAGVVGTFGYADYSASKFGLIGLSEVLRSELRSSGVGVTVLCPPDTDTPGFEVENRTKPKETVAISEGAKLMQSSDVAAALVKGIEKRRFMIIPGLDGKITCRLKNRFPSLVFSILDRIVAKSQRGN